MAEAGTQLYLGSTQINAAGLYFSDKLVSINPFTTGAAPIPAPIPTSGLQMWLDPTTYTSSGSVWLSALGNGTGSFTGSYIYSGSNFFNYNQATKVNFSTTSGSLNYSTTQNTIFIVGRASGSGAPGTVGRLLNGKSNNWLMGTQSTTAMTAYDAGGVAGYFATPFDNAWRVHTGIWQNSLSASYYVNGVFVTTLTAPGYGGRVGPNGLCVNDVGGENGQGDIGDIIIYNRILTDAEITTVYDAIKGKYGLT